VPNPSAFESGIVADFKCTRHENASESVEPLS
jgi:hypothetical protein